MNLKSSVIMACLTLCISQIALAAEKDANCQKVVEACKAAGFADNDSKKGENLWTDCVNLLAQAKAPPKTSKKPLPKMDVNIIVACKTKNPNFGN